jgi:hypothetical protein
MGRLLRPLASAIASQEKNGAQGRDRTADTAIFSRMLYQLSYLGIAGGASAPGGSRAYKAVSPSLSSPSAPLATSTSAERPGKR